MYFTFLNRTFKLVNRVNNVFCLKKCSILVFFFICFNLCRLS
ncbi:hypothetical protein D1AOALGA4SA_2495 [Olavius algarvensis Delta 1 endosymbiont]|nr:hypothetical protein D1AOALGA4SA_2495 [Olavius algarvensis Delta 1 endosymbiont]